MIDFIVYCNVCCITVQCGPPTNVTFKRSYGRLNVTAEWDDSNVKQYLLKFREHNTTVWKEVKIKISLLRMKPRPRACFEYREN